MNDKTTTSLPQDYRQSIKDMAVKLAEMLFQSPEYTQLMRAKTKLEADREQAFILMELRQQQMAIRMAAMMGEDLEDSSEIDDMFVMLSQEPIISDYLFAEGRFFRLIADVEDVFSHTLNLGHFIEESEIAPHYDISLN